MILEFSIKNKDIEYIFDRSTNIYYVYLKSNRNKIGIGKTLKAALKDFKNAK